MASGGNSVPQLREVVGAMLLAARGSVTVAQIRQACAQVAQEKGGLADALSRVTDEQIRAAVAELQGILEAQKTGLRIAEVAHGYRLQNDPACGPWVRRLLDRGRRTRLSRAALETLAIIAYRQPCVRSEIEAVRGVQVDQILRNLLEMQLIRIVGRSDLPGRPMLLATTDKFLEYFGLKSLEELPGLEELRRREAAHGARKEPAELEQKGGATMSAAKRDEELWEEEEQEEEFEEEFGDEEEEFFEEGEEEESEEGEEEPWDEP